MNKILLVAGARPNFMKIAPILRELEKNSSVFQAVMVHTGQHYDYSMSASFFSDLGMKEPDYNLEVGSGSHAVQTANIIIRFEEVCIKEKPDLVMVVGDVNSTIAAGLVAKKLHIQLSHVEAGLRSNDRSMPEEINRIATDAITDIFFTTEEEGTANLIREGHAKEKIHFVGHVMIDNLFYQLEKVRLAAPSQLSEAIKSNLPQKYCCVTLHRPSNVDIKDNLLNIIEALSVIAQDVPILFPCHPRTKRQIEFYGFSEKFNLLDFSKSFSKGIFLTEPLGYNDFLYIWKEATVVLTDSGGLQEETTALKIPCITLRGNTERPITVSKGSNVIVGTNKDKIIEYAFKAINGNWKTSEIPFLWDGKACERIVAILKKNMLF